jgi:hypothetical protein
MFSKILGDIRSSRCTHPLVSLTPVANVKKSLIRKVLIILLDTGGEFATGVLDTGGPP